MAFKKVATLEELWSGEMKDVVVDGQKVVLIHLVDSIQAFENRCVHKGVELSQGHLAGDTLTCSAHHWQYNAKTGCGINPLGTQLKQFAVQIQNKDILVDVNHVLAESKDNLLGQRKQENAVGPILESGDVTNAVISAIQELNPHVSIQNRGAYLRVSSPHQCIVTRKKIEEKLGKPFILPGDLELIMPSFQGKFTVTEEEALWKFEE